ncbi:MAG: GMC family oxidoreductase N-terminal domain-containing protein [Solirubrobacterales bacterium]
MGGPHTYPHAPHPVSSAASVAWRGAEDCGIPMRVGPVGITNGVFGHRPHCIYRGFCLQGCKVNAKASPLITHLPDAIEHGVEVRADSMVTRVEVDDASGRCTGVTYVHGGRSASSPPTPSRSAGTRSRLRGCCCTRRAGASRTAWATSTTRSAAT